jgi:hypothetical protein
MLALTQTGPPGLGWTELTNTRLAPVCPPATADYDFIYHCQAIITAWNSAAFDANHNRLLIFGGGHADYLGNEIYALELSRTPPAMMRLTDPSLDVSNPTCGPKYPDGRPCSRHTYDGLAYLSHVDRLFVAGGSKSPCGFLADDVWTYDFSQAKWFEMNPSGPKPDGVPGYCSAYDPVTRKVFLHDDRRLYAYDFDSNAWELKSSEDFAIDYHLTGALDLKARRFYLVGSGEVHVYDLEGPNAFVGRTLTTTGGGTVVEEVYPGLAWDSTHEKLVGWAGGDSVYVFDDATNTWTASTAPGGFAQPQGNGTYKRFTYVPQWNGFVLVNEAAQDARFYRIGPPLPYDGGMPPDAARPGLDASSAPDASTAPSDAGSTDTGSSPPFDAGAVALDSGAGLDSGSARDAGTTSSEGGAGNPFESSCGCGSAASSPLGLAGGLVALILRRRRS